jgi:ATP-dependent helicase/nuclease subunit B
MVWWSVVMHVFESPSAVDRFEAARHFVASFPAGTELLVLSASREAADDFCRAITRDRTTTFGLHRLTLHQYASRTASAALAARGLALCTPLGAEAVAARAAFEADHRGAVRHVAPVIGCPGFPRALAATLNDLRQAAIPAAAIRTLPESGADLAVLLDEFDHQLAAAGAADRAMLLFEAARVMRDEPAASLATLPVLLLDVRVSTPAEEAVIASFVASSPAMLATVPAGDHRTLQVTTRQGAVAYPATATDAADLAEPASLADFLKPAKAPVDAAKPAPRVGQVDADAASPAPASRHGGSAIARIAPSVHRLQQQLFIEDAARGEIGEDVEFFSAPGEGRECVEVARRILNEARRGTPFDDIAIVVRAPESYWGLLEHALQRAGIKAWFSRGTRRPDPSGRAFLALLACASEGLSARRFAEYLSLGQVPPRDATGATPPIAPVWRPPTEETLAPGQLSLLDLFETETGIAPDPEPQPESGRSARNLKSGSRSTSPATATDTSPADAAGIAADTGAADLDPAQAEGTVRAPRQWEALLVESAVIGGADRWARRLKGLGEELRLKINEETHADSESPYVAALQRDLAQLDELRRFALPVIGELAALPEAALWGEWLDRLDALAPRVLRHPERVLALLTELRPMAAVGPLTLGEVREVLTPRLATLEREPPKHRYGRVFVGTPAQLRGRVFRVVFVTGLAERIFPQKSRPDPLLLDDLRRRLTAMGAVGLEAEDDRVLNERLLLRLAVGAARERLYLSYPRVDVAQARSRVPSFYALDIVRALTGEVPNYERFERNTAVQSSAWLAWPAPADAAEAIDECEHDLAILGPLLKPGGERDTVRGQAHYLLQLNERLRQSLLMRWARWKRTWSSFDGLLKVSDETKQALATQRLTARPYSVSALQRFAACPYQFLLGSIYKLEPLEQPAPLERLDPLTKGALFHEIQRDVLRALKAADLIPLTVAGVARAFQVLDRAVADAAERYHDRLAPAIERVWQDEIESLRGDLRMWLSRWVDAEGGWEPVHFEFSFGMPLDGDHDPSSVRAPVTLAAGDGRQFQLRGAIDLIERNPLTGALRVTDHKTGKNRTTPYLVVGGGATLQPVIYGMVVEQVFSKSVSQSRLYFSTTVGGFTEHQVSMRDEARRAGMEVLEIIDRAIGAAQLPVAPRDGACGWCDFRAICGPLEERRFRQKAKEPDIVGDLIELRSLR